MAKTLYDKVWQAHIIDQIGEDSLIYIDRHLIHEVLRHLLALMKKAVKYVALIALLAQWITAYQLAHWQSTRVDQLTRFNYKP